ncbi:hypothetical protein TNCT_727361, partial [Trichonephila clavata]
IRTTSEVISATCTCPAGGTPTFCKQVFAPVMFQQKTKMVYAKVETDRATWYTAGLRVDSESTQMVQDDAD